MPWCRASTETADGRTFLSIPVDRYYLDRGWSAFEGLAEVMECHAIDPATLEHRYTEQNYSVMVAVFEVVA